MSIYTQPEAATKLKVQPWVIRHLIDTGKIAEPKRLGTGQRAPAYFTDGDLKILAAVLAVTGYKKIEKQR